MSTDDSSQNTAFQGTLRFQQVLMRQLLKEKEKQVCIHSTVKTNVLSGFEVKLNPKD